MMNRPENELQIYRQKRAAAQGAAKKQEVLKMDEEVPPIVSPAFISGPIDEGHMERNRIVAHRTRCAEADVCRQLRTKVLQIMNAHGYKTLAITSPYHRNGKTTTALNLGISIAFDLKQTVLLVDLDLRKPDLHRYLGVKPRVGLTDHLLRGAPLNDCFVRTPFKRISVLPVKTALNRSSELLSSPKMTLLAQELKTRYADRLVIYDMPPVLTQDDPIAFLPQVDAVLVVVRDGSTRADDMKRCLNALEKANVIGIVLNNCW